MGLIDRLEELRERTDVRGWHIDAQHDDDPVVDLRLSTGGVQHTLRFHANDVGEYCELMRGLLDRLEG